MARHFFDMFMVCYMANCILHIGALFVKSPAKDTPLHPLLFGGGQERGFRPGTENTGMISGLGEAAQLVVDNLETYSTHMRKVG